MTPYDFVTALPEEEKGSSVAISFNQSKQKLARILPHHVQKCNVCR